MLAYVLPGSGIYGGVKKGFHCADMLTAAGYACAVATPDGSRPSWFESACEVITHQRLLSICRPDDTVLFSCPADAPFVDRLPAHRKVVHMQGANTTADRELFDPGRGYELISHGHHMTYELHRVGRVAPYVPMGVPDLFRWNGERKTAMRIVVMPRKGGHFVDAVRRTLPSGSQLVCLDALHERAVAEAMKGADIFLAISPSEAFGLPPLEAMCAACCVVGFPGVGGFEFMRHQDTAHVVPNGDLPGLLSALRDVCASPLYRAALRRSAHELAGYYSMERERTGLLRALRLDGAAGQ